jgi:hypothetical protein
MKFTALALLAWATMALSNPAPPQASNHVQWVNQSLTQMKQIKEGMTRADLEKVFVMGSGFQVKSSMTYEYRECPFFKVDVQFEQAPDSGVTGSPKDKIIEISKPYLEQPVDD